METALPVHPPEPPPLLPVSRVHPAVLPVGRRGRRRFASTASGGSGSAVVILGCQRAAADRLLAVVPLAPPPRRRPDRLLLVHAPDAGPPRPLAAADRAQPPPHGVGLGEPDHGHPRRRLRAPARAGRHHRPGDPLLGDRCSIAPPTKPQIRPHDVLVIGAGGAGLRAAIEAQAAGARRRAGLQVAPRQGPHGHGRGRRRGGARPRRRRRHLADPLPRHDGRRQAPQQPADGRAPRQGGARTASASSSTGARSSTGPATGGSSSGRSAATRTRASPTSATGPVSR